MIYPGDENYSDLIATYEKHRTPVIELNGVFYRVFTNNETTFVEIPNVLQNDGFFRGYYPPEGDLDDFSDLASGNGRRRNKIY